MLTYRSTFKIGKDLCEFETLTTLESEENTRNI
jgi:hypothetical protein